MRIVSIIQGPCLCSSCASCLEQMEIGKSKSKGELLNWDDVNKMRYSWNVACEVIRIVPIIQEIFREAIKKLSSMVLNSKRMEGN